VAALFLALPGPARAAGASAVNPALEYVLQLRLSTTPTDPATLPDLPILRTHRVYETSYTKDGRRWYRLRLGFFATAGAAAARRAELEPDFPGNWVTRASAAERRASAANALAVPGAKRAAPKLPPVSDERLTELMEAARQALAEGRFAEAIRTYTKVLEYPGHRATRDALELLGLARERGGQVAHAKAVYEQYIERYPDGEATDRVRQRLAGLITAREPAPEKLREAKAAPEAASWDAFGGMSQFYRRSAFTDPTGTTRVQLSEIATDLDITARRRSGNVDLRTRLTAGYDLDLLADGPGDETRVTSLYLEASRRTGQLSVRAGRQSRSTGGVLGRFDGARLTVGVTPRTAFTLVAGFPVERSTDMSVNTDRHFYGATYALGTFAQAWDMNVFWIAQTVDGTPDREAVGGELRYFRPERSLFTLVDYDILFDTLNTFLFLGTWTRPSGTSLHLTLDERKTPVLTTSNALQGQAVGTIDALLATPLTEAEVRRLALDQTATQRSVNLGLTRPLSKKLQLATDLTLSSRTATNGSTFPVLVAPLPEGDEYALSVTLTGSSLIKTGDIAVVALRYTNNESTDTTALTLNTRYPINGAWRVNPRVGVDFRRNESDGSEQWTTRPGLRMEYRMLKRVRFEVEASGEWSTRHLTADTERTSGYYLSAGYRFDF
jgi:tetratricopeptide (TPR) repeat protein